MCGCVMRGCGPACTCRCHEPNRTNKPNLFLVKLDPPIRPDDSQFFNQVTELQNDFA